MKTLTVSFELTDIQMQALEAEARKENLKINELVAWMIRQNIPALLDLIESEDSSWKKDLSEKLADDQEK